MKSITSLCCIDKEYLQNVLGVLFFVLQERNPYLKVQFDSTSSELIELAIGNQNDVSEITWFRLFSDYKKLGSSKMQISLFSNSVIRSPYEY